MDEEDDELDVCLIAVEVYLRRLMWKEREMDNMEGADGARVVVEHAVAWP